MNIPRDTANVLSALELHGIKAYPVGGCVRDFVLGKVPNDFDIAASATPDELCHAAEAAGFRTVDVGLSFGTLRFISGESVIEVTCCRSEGDYRDCRRPDSVVYTKDIRTDLSRRDFTVNAMAYSKDEGIIDLFGGIEDAKNKIIRTVGLPEDRFREDALRILRALRFSSVLDFDIDADTKAAIHALYPLLTSIASERIYEELKKLLCGKRAVSVLSEFSDVICEIIPELSPAVGFEQRNPYHIYDVYTHSVKAVGFCPENDFTLRLCALLHDIGKPCTCTEDEKGIRHFKDHPEKGAEIAKKVLHRLRADTKTVNEICDLIKFHDVRPLPTERDMHLYLLKTGFPLAKRLFALRFADLRAHAPICEKQLAELKEEERITAYLEEKNACVSLSQLNINGKDIIKSGIAAGPRVGEILNSLLIMVAEGKCENEKNSLNDAVISNFFEK